MREETLEIHIFRAKERSLASRGKLYTDLPVESDGA